MKVDLGKLDLHIYLHEVADSATQTKLDKILTQLGLLKTEVHTMAGELDALESTVADEVTVIGSAVTLLDGLKAKLDEAIASGDMGRVVAVTATIAAKKQDLADAVARNTPAA